MQTSLKSHTNAFLMLALCLVSSPVSAHVAFAAALKTPSVSNWIVYLKPPSLSTTQMASEVAGSQNTQRLRAIAQRSQRGVTELLSQAKQRGEVQSFESLWIINAIAVTATDEVIQALALHPDILRVEPDRIIELPKRTPGSRQQSSALTPTWNLDLIHAPAMWSLGFTGQNITLAILDTGVDASHPDLAGKWRGGSNSWFDPYDQHPTAPIDLDGHGTQVLGVMLAGDASGAQLGVAPDAKWIAARVFKDNGVGTTSAIHRVFQWVLDPDNDPTTNDVPQIVNNSWASLSSLGSCDLTFEPDLIALRAIGILPVFASGNSQISVSPANNPSAFSVGATDYADALYADSGRGPRPDTCGSAVYPDLVAPGVAITTTDTFGFYINDSGTSLAAPHVSGALALLLSAHPNLSASAQAAALRNGVIDLGNTGPDTRFGFGRLDVFRVHQWLETTSNLSVTLMASSNPTVTTTGFTYALSVTNLGPLTATHVVLTLTLPTGVMALPQTGCTGSRIVVCSMDDLGVTASMSLPVSVAVQPTAPNVLVSTAALSAYQSDPDLDNNTARSDNALSRILYFPLMFQHGAFRRFVFLPSVTRP